MSKTSIQKKMGTVLTSFAEIQKKLQAIVDEFGVDAVKHALKELEAEKSAKDALQKLIEGLWVK